MNADVKNYDFGAFCAKKFTEAVFVLHCVKSLTPVLP